MEIQNILCKENNPEKENSVKIAKEDALESQREKNQKLLKQFLKAI